MRPSTPALLPAAALLLCAALEALAARPAPPPVGGTRAETEDEDFSAGPSRTTAISLARDAGDAIDDSVMPQRRIAGVQNFTGKLDTELVRYGVDHPRYQILKNAEDAWGALQAGYDPLREGLDRLAQARDTLDEITQALRPLVAGSQEDAAALRSVADRIRDLVGAMTSEPPGGDSAQADASSLGAIGNNVEARKAEVARINAMIDLAYQQSLSAKGPVAESRAALGVVAGFADKAAALDEDSNRRVTDNRVSGARNGAGVGVNSEKVIAMAGGRLDAAVTQAEKVAVDLSKLAAPDRGPFALAAKAAAAAGKQAKGGCSCCGKGASQSNQLSGQLSQLRDQYNGATNQEERQSIAERARSLVQQGQAARDSANKDTKKAEDASERARRLLADAEQLLERIRAQELGEESRGQLRADLPTLSTPSTSAQAPAGGSAPARSQMRVKSKPVRGLEGLGMSDSEISQAEFGAGATLDAE